jgi:lipid A 3-O-deacylase
MHIRTQAALRLTALLCLAGAGVSGPFLRAEATPAADPTGIWTIQVENDAVSTLRGTSDQYYTSGLRLGWTSGTDQVPGALSRIGRALWGDGVQRISFDLSQSVFTPRNTQISPPDPHDRPYAGWLNGTFSLLQDKDDSRSILAVSLGVVGPSALGRQVQNGFHDLIGDTPNRGWHFQLQDEPAIETYAERIWRLPIASFGPFETDALPDATLGLGTVRDYVLVGARLRIGQGLGSDFSPARIRPGMTGADAYTPTRPFAWYVFVGADGQAVARDVFLDGSTFRSHSPHVSKNWDVGELEAGIGVMLYGVRLSYTQTWQTQEFKGQKGGLFNFGSLALSARF